MTVVDVDEASFEAEVLLRSATLPVVVDFWAAWCAPCRALGPLLESAAAARDGQVVLAKLDTDANPRLSGSFGIQGIPAVKAFRDGAVVDEFVGVKPPAAVERFFDGLVPSEVDDLVGAGDEASLRRAVELEPGRADAAIPLARMLRARGDTPAALATLSPVIANFEAEGLGARIRLEAARGERVTSDPDPVVAALRALDDGEVELGLDLLIGELAGGDQDTRDDIRRVIVAELDRLGVEHPLAREGRRRLAAALY